MNAPDRPVVETPEQSATAASDRLAVETPEQSAMAAPGRPVVETPDRAAVRAPVGPGRSYPGSWPVAAAGLLVAVGVLAALLWYGGATRREILPGLVDAGPITPWLLPAARLGMQVGAVVTVGLLLAAVLFSARAAGGGLSATGYRRVRAAAWSALGWCLASLAALCLTLADVLGLPIAEAVSPTSVVNFATTVQLGQALALSGWMTGAIFLICRAALTPRTAGVALLLAVLAMVPPVFTGHAAAASNHQLAVSGLLLHVVPVAVWAGGLLALALTGRARTDQLAIAVRRFSPLAAGCLLLVAASGLVSAYVRLPGPGALVDTPYGQLVLLKTLLLGTLAAAGWWQRRTALPALLGGDRSRFIRIAGVEVLLFAAAMGTAVALSRTPAPVPGGPEESIAQALLGYPLPAAPDVARLLGDWLPEPILIAVALAAAGYYLGAVTRLRRTGGVWPAWRTGVFLLGCAVIVVATSSGLARYAPLLFSVHLIQQLLLTMVAPLLLVLAAPLTLARRVLPTAVTPGWPGVREWLRAAGASRLGLLLTRPPVAMVLLAATGFPLYFTGIYDQTLRSHAAHLLMIGYFLAAGCLFFWVVLGVDPVPRRSGYPTRLLSVLLLVVSQVVLGLVLARSGSLLAADWSTALARPWGDPPLVDQQTAGHLLWSLGNLPPLAALVLLAVRRRRETVPRHP
ncbi:bifunctional copper resistance protein CopD/cytochrome c oxidase assembly protein [Micromonospora sp. NBC_01699]|uniref:cytochrome c oxidase assembly protein n=1 Tax=Micromonospora sp. NBC_01699 TaxID=2975984 RepID=UPI002E2BB817|nr:cytochrome c oxidase assembly protein [Micromonospora sp. NBC_01699]